RAEAAERTRTRTTGARRRGPWSASCGPFYAIVALRTSGRTSACTRDEIRSHERQQREGDHPGHVDCRDSSSQRRGGRAWGHGPGAKGDLTCPGCRDAALPGAVERQV